jgi:hypothetical protein
VTTFDKAILRQHLSDASMEVFPKLIAFVYTISGLFIDRSRDPWNSWIYDPIPGKDAHSKQITPLPVFGSDLTLLENPNVCSQRISSGKYGQIVLQWDACLNRS